MSTADEASAAREDDAVAAPAGADSTPDTVDGVAAFARLYGEPLFKLPQDLYIRPTRSRCSSKRSKARSICCCT